MGASLTQGHAHFSSRCGFIVGLGKPKLCTKFEVASFSHCVNESGTTKFQGATLVLGHAHFSYGCDYMISLENPSYVPYLKSLAPAIV